MERTVSERNSESPKSEESPGQKQDPLERRRLQNRLSQRNHRRKIRDRIAKLQERVIANELRASAALNGWDQTYTPPFLPTRHSYHSNADFNSISNDPSPLPAECSQFIPQCTISSPSWSSQPAITQSSTLPRSPLNSSDGGSFDIEPSFPASSMPDLIHSPRFPLPTASSQEGSIHDSLSSNCSPLSENLPSVSTNQSLYYVATETSLPQILQALSSVSPQSKIIVVVPPDTTTSVTSSLGSPAIWPGSSSLRDYFPTPLNALNMACQCQDPSTNCISSAQTYSRTWNVPRSYIPDYPLNKLIGSPCGIFP
ncbi:hypothetical protein N7495_001301 [Penicillium taxi]|uniref:uncharacterized protein n=1 Tax=Penicillium taxi TaxID=168475 RepID=UPI0025454FF2|nr:uncharacterized protein N7495_001301 [Penicillium taxi]KAJ5908619.1 hypothetical protein N7495_001301 [Penicillium taxi]